MTKEIGLELASTIECDICKCKMLRRDFKRHVLTSKKHSLNLKINELEKRAKKA